MAGKQKNSLTKDDQGKKTTIRIKSGDYSALERIMVEEGHSTVTSVMNTIFDERVRLIPETARLIQGAELRIEQKMDAVRESVEVLISATDKIANAVQSVFERISFEEDEGDERVLTEKTTQDGTIVTIDQHGVIVEDKNKGWKGEGET